MKDLVPFTISYCGTRVQYYWEHDHEKVESWQEGVGERRARQGQVTSVGLKKIETEC